MKDGRKLLLLKFIAACLVITAVAGLVVTYIYETGLYPRGYDTMYYIYRGQSLHDSISQGVWFPQYDQYLYNGVQPLAQWAPLSTYMLALLCFITDDILLAYLGYVGILIVLGALGWLLFGIRYKRMALAAFLGIVWFFVPDNIQVLFGAGNLPRSLVAALLPWFCFFLYGILEEERKKWDAVNLAGFAGVLAVMILSSFSQAIVVLMVTAVFLLLYALIHRSFKQVKWVFFSGISGMLLTGIWTFSLIVRGNITLVETGASLKSSFQSAFETLNPVLHMENPDLMYIGIIYLVLATGGLVLSNKKAAAGFATGLVVFFSTTLSAYAFFSRLPFADFMVVDHFVTVGLFLILISLLFWEQIKRWILVVCCVLLLLDCVPDVETYIYASKEEWVDDAWQVIDEHAALLSLDVAKSVTEQRIALLDLSTYVAFAPYYLAGRSNKTLCTFGAAWQSAYTAENIVRLNTALTEGYYEYLFDRCVELGNDTIFLRSDLLENKTADLEEAVEAAEKMGYSLVHQDDVNCVLHMDTPQTFGVYSEYEAIAIGAAANEMALYYPQLKETEDTNLNHYTFEELSGYEKIYLSDFTYEDKEQAEELLYELAEAGCDIYIDMNRIPQEDVSEFARFMGVSALSIGFKDAYPQLEYEGTVYETGTFPEGEENWNTVYLSDVDKIEGTADFNGEELVFAGTDESGKIHYIGFNLPYYMLSTKDESISGLMDELLDLDSEDTPKRTLVPIEVSYEKNQIVINSDVDCMNTTLAFLDHFVSDSTIWEENHLLFVNKGTTVITFYDPYLEIGAAISAAGMICLLVLMWIYQKSRQKKESEKEAVRKAGEDNGISTMY